MSIKRFVAGSTSEALRKVRDTLGSEAVILSNRAIGEGIEILALAHADMTALILPEPEGIKHAAKATKEVEEKPAENRSPGEAGSPLGGHSSSRGDRAHETAKAASRKLQVNQAPQTDRQSFSGDHQWTDGEGKASSAQTREIFKAFKAVRATRTMEEPKSSKTSNTPNTLGAGNTPKISKAPRTTVASKASNVSELSNASSDAPPVSQGADIGIELPGTKNSRAGTNPDSSRSMKKKRLPRHSAPARRPVAENSEKYAARLEKLREKRAPAKGAAVRAPEGGQSVQADTLRRIANEAAASVLQEINSMRGTLEQKLAALSWGMQQRLDPVHGGLVRQLMAAGFGGPLVRDLVDQLPTGIGEKEALDRARSLLVENLQAMDNENEILEKGGVYALVGPTGVGKTTTTAKLAARCVLRHGAEKVALLTTDGYRIGGHEQLRIYGKILGITVHAVRDKRDLALALAELRGRHIVLIDTVGMGQRDQMVAEQAAMLAGCGEEIKRLVLLNAASNRYTLDEVAHAYCGNGLAGAIITKLDEAVVTGCALDTAIRHRLPLYYVTRGQRVPEDMELAHPASLVNSALNNLPDVSGFAALEDEFAFSAGAPEDCGIRHSMSEVHLG